MKPILFNQEMVRALLDGRKSATRRIVKQKGWEITGRPAWGNQDDYGRFWFTAANNNTATVIPVNPPYRPGEIIYVRETWYQTPNGMYWYKADNICLGCTEDGLCISEKEPYYKKVPYHKTCDLCEYLDGHENIKWRPSIHMPKEAARLFLRVTGIRAERLRDIADEDLIKEVGVNRSDTFVTNETLCWMNNGEIEPLFVKLWKLWDSTVRKVDLPRYGWNASPWVWVIGFERISKEEALKSES